MMQGYIRSYATLFDIVLVDSGSRFDVLGWWGFKIMDSENIVEI